MMVPRRRDEPDEGWGPRGTQEPSPAQGDESDATQARRAWRGGPQQWRRLLAQQEESERAQEAEENPLERLSGAALYDYLKQQAEKSRQERQAARSAPSVPAPSRDASPSAATGSPLPPEPARLELESPRRPPPSLREQEESTRQAVEREASDRFLWEVMEQDRRAAQDQETQDETARLLQEAQARALEDLERREREARDREAREQALREKESRDREIREREIRELRERELQARATQAREEAERQAREREAREREARERELREKEAREREARDRELRERELREKEARERELQALRAQAEAERQAREEAERQAREEAERQAREEALRLSNEREARERDRLEAEAREPALLVRQAREQRDRQAREREAQEREEQPRGLRTQAAEGPARKEASPAGQEDPLAALLNDESWSARALREALGIGVSGAAASESRRPSGRARGEIPISQPVVTTPTSRPAEPTLDDMDEWDELPVPSARGPVLLASRGPVAGRPTGGATAPGRSPSAGGPQDRPEAPRDAWAGEGVSGRRVPPGVGDERRPLPRGHSAPRLEALLGTPRGAEAAEVTPVSLRGRGEATPVQAGQGPTRESSPSRILEDGWDEARDNGWNETTDAQGRPAEPGGGEWLDTTAAREEAWSAEGGPGWGEPTAARGEPWAELDEAGPEASEEQTPVREAGWAEGAEPGWGEITAVRREQWSGGRPGGESLEASGEPTAEHSPGWSSPGVRRDPSTGWWGEPEVLLAPRLEAAEEPASAWMQAGEGASVATHPVEAEGADRLAADRLDGHRLDAEEVEADSADEASEDWIEGPEQGAEATEDGRAGEGAEAGLEAMHPDEEALSGASGEALREAAAEAEASVWSEEALAAWTSSSVESAAPVRMPRDNWDFADANAVGASDEASAWTESDDGAGWEASAHADGQADEAVSVADVSLYDMELGSSAEQGEAALAEAGEWGSRPLAGRPSGTEDVTDLAASASEAGFSTPVEAGQSSSYDGELSGAWPVVAGQGAPTDLGPGAGWQHFSPSMARASGRRRAPSPRRPPPEPSIQSALSVLLGQLQVELQAAPSIRWEPEEPLPLWMERLLEVVDEHGVDRLFSEDNLPPDSGFRRGPPVPMDEVRDFWDQVLVEVAEALPDQLALARAELAWREAEARAEPLELLAELGFAEGEEAEGRPLDEREKVGAADRPAAVPAEAGPDLTAESQTWVEGAPDLMEGLEAPVAWAEHRLASGPGADGFAPLSDEPVEFEGDNPLVDGVDLGMDGLRSDLGVVATGSISPETGREPPLEALVEGFVEAESAVAGGAEGSEPLEARDPGLEVWAGDDAMGPSSPSREGALAGWEGGQEVGEGAVLNGPWGGQDAERVTEAALAAETPGGIGGEVGEATVGHPGVAGERPGDPGLATGAAEPTDLGAESEGPDEGRLEAGGGLAGSSGDGYAAAAGEVSWDALVRPVSPRLETDGGLDGMEAWVQATTGPKDPLSAGRDQHAVDEAGPAGEAVVSGRVYPEPAFQGEYEQDQALTGRTRTDAALAGDPSGGGGHRVLELEGNARWDGTHWDEAPGDEAGWEATPGDASSVEVAPGNAARAAAAYAESTPAGVEQGEGALGGDVGAWAGRTGDLEWAPDGQEVPIDTATSGDWSEPAASRLPDGMARPDTWATASREPARGLEGRAVIEGGGSAPRMEQEELVSARDGSSARGGEGRLPRPVDGEGSEEAAASSGAAGGGGFDELAAVLGEIDAAHGGPVVVEAARDVHVHDGHDVRIQQELVVVEGMEAEEGDSLSEALGELEGDAQAFSVAPPSWDGQPSPEEVRAAPVRQTPPAPWPAPSSGTIPPYRGGMSSGVSVEESIPPYRGGASSPAAREEGIPRWGTVPLPDPRGMAARAAQAAQASQVPGGPARGPSMVTGSVRTVAGVARPGPAPSQPSEAGPMAPGVNMTRPPVAGSPGTTAPSAAAPRGPAPAPGPARGPGSVGGPGGSAARGGMDQAPGAGVGAGPGQPVASRPMPAPGSMGAPGVGQPGSASGQGGGTAQGSGAPSSMPSAGRPVPPMPSAAPGAAMRPGQPGQPPGAPRAAGPVVPSAPGGVPSSSQPGSAPGMGGGGPTVQGPPPGARQGVPTGPAQPGPRPAGPPSASRGPVPPSPRGPEPVGPQAAPPRPVPGQPASPGAARGTLSAAANAAAQALGGGSPQPPSRPGQFPPGARGEARGADREPLPPPERDERAWWLPPAVDPAEGWVGAPTPPAPTRQGPPAPSRPSPLEPPELWPGVDREWGEDPRGGAPAGWQGGENVPPPWPPEGWDRGGARGGYPEEGGGFQPPGWPPYSDPRGSWGRRDWRWGQEREPQGWGGRRPDGYYGPPAEEAHRESYRRLFDYPEAPPARSEEEAWPGGPSRGGRWPQETRRPPAPPRARFSDRRDYPRLIAPPGMVYFRYQGRVATGDLGDLSATGAMVRTRTPLAPGTSVPVALELPPLTRPVRAVARVVYVRWMEAVPGTPELAAMGICFEQLAMEERQVLTDYLLHMGR